jgi:hypothetical protein
MTMTIRRFLTSVAVLATVLLAGAFALAQAAQDVKQVQKEVKIIAGGQAGGVWAGAAGDHFTIQGGNFTFINAEVGFDSKVVKGSPMSADAVTEFIQTLSNGQRIYRRTSSVMYRDSEGRTRKEQSIAAIGPYAPSGPAKQTIYINDPVAGVSYSLNPEDHTAVRTTISMDGVDAALAHKVTVFHGAGGTARVKVAEAVTGGVAGGVISKKLDSVAIANHAGVTAHAASEARTESLGAQLIAGVQAEGTRTTVTIPAGAIGNEGPIDIVHEVWYSQELGMVVKSVRNDPMTGENVYQLTNIRRGEPAASLFQVPPEYAIKDGGHVELRIHTLVKPEIKK